MGKIDIKKSSKDPFAKHSDSESEQEAVKKPSLMDLESEDDFGSDSEDEQEKVFATHKKPTHIDTFTREDDDDEDEEINEIDQINDEDDPLDKDDTDILHKETKRNNKLKRLSPEQLAKEQKKIKKTGVCYLSKIPPFMKPAKLRSVLTRFGKIDRLFLKPEDTATYRKRVKYGGNKKKMYTEGWVEFVNKKDAKLCAATLNANTLGGRKTSYYYDDVINMKYLSGFKWFDLTQQIAKENEVRQAKLSLEIAQQQKLNKNFVTNVERSKMVKNIQNKRKAKQEESGVTQAPSEKDIEMRRNFKQRKVTSTRADADDSLKERAKPNNKLNDVLSKVF